jgi:hypothetical protein
LKKLITAQASEISHLKGLKAQGLNTPESPTAAAPGAVSGAAPKGDNTDTSKMTAAQLISLGRKQVTAAGQLKTAA